MDPIRTPRQRALPATVRRWRMAALLLSSLLLGACDKPPLPLGFVGGLTGRAADLATSGRDAVLLAVEQVNAAGGIGGRPVTLVAADDQHDPLAARDAFQTLRTAQVELTIGPMTSAMAMELVPLANQSSMVLLSPTVTTSALTGLDDRFFRVIASTREYAIKSAAYHAGKSGLRRVAVVLDEGNAAFTERWLTDFEAEFARLGGTLVHRESYRFHADISFARLAERALQPAPDGVLVLASAADAALLTQQLRKLAPAVPVLASEWAATDQFVAMGGAAVEGVYVAQFMDWQSEAPRYLDFQAAFQQRYGRPAGFAAVAAYDAALVALEALRQRRAGEDLKDTLLRLRRFEGLQQPVEFDPSGDAQRETHITVVRGGRYLVQP